MNLINQLVNVYLAKEHWHRTKLSKEDAIDYFERLLKKNSIIWRADKGKLVGYIEYWKINLPQLYRVLTIGFSAYKEDINTGYICYVANTWIDENYRNTIYKDLRNDLFKLNKDCYYFVGRDVERNNRLRVHRRV